MLLTIIVFLLVLSLLVIVHEFGHFIVGKKAGIGVLEFALGLPFTKPLWSKKLKNGMKVSLYPLLFGGFVNLLGEEGEVGTKTSVMGKLFYRTPIATRIAVVIAGVAMNFLLAIIAFYIFLGLSNFKVLIPRFADYQFLSPNETRIVAIETLDGSPAKEAGILFGEVITKVNGEEISSVSQFRDMTTRLAGQEVLLELVSSDLTNTREVKVVPRANPAENQGALGVQLGEGAILRYDTFGEKLTSGVVYGVDMLVYNIKVIAHFIFAAFQTGDASAVTDSVSGPIGIAKIVDDILKLPFFEAAKTMVNFVGLLSLSLAFMNILPIPAMDGGRLTFLLVEAIFGKRMAASRENLINQVGMVLLLGLIILISFNDIVKIVTR